VLVSFGGGGDGVTSVLADKTAKRFGHTEAVEVYEAHIVTVDGQELMV